MTGSGSRHGSVARRWGPPLPGDQPTRWWTVSRQTRRACSSTCHRSSPTPMPASPSHRQTETARNPTDRRFVWPRYARPASMRTAPMRTEYRSRAAKSAQSHNAGRPTSRLRWSTRPPTTTPTCAPHGSAEALKSIRSRSATASTSTWTNVGSCHSSLDRCGGTDRSKRRRNEYAYRWQFAPSLNGRRETACGCIAPSYGASNTHPGQRAGSASSPARSSARTLTQRSSAILGLVATMRPAMFTRGRRMIP